MGPTRRDPDSQKHLPRSQGTSRRRTPVPFCRSTRPRTRRPHSTTYTAVSRLTPDRTGLHRERVTSRRVPNERVDRLLDEDVNPDCLEGLPPTPLPTPSLGEKGLF